jgi:hypothetical protein
LRGRRDEQTFLAVAGDDHLSLLAAFEDGVETVQAEIVFGLVFSVTTHAGGFEERENILLERNSLLIRSSGEFADINLADVPFVWRRILGGGRKAGQPNSESGQSDCMFHVHVGHNMA